MAQKWQTVRRQTRQQMPNPADTQRAHVHNQQGKQNQQRLSKHEQSQGTESSQEKTQIKTLCYIKRYQVHSSHRQGRLATLSLTTLSVGSGWRTRTHARVCGSGHPFGGALAVCPNEEDLVFRPGAYTSYKHAPDIRTSRSFCHTQRLKKT